jgi:hypothetical protein
MLIFLQFFLHNNYIYQDSNAKDDSDMDDIEIELEIHVSPKKSSNDNKQISLTNNKEAKSLPGHDLKYSR